MAVNVALDRTAPIVYCARVLDKRVLRQGKLVRYYFKLSPWGPRGWTQEVQVEYRDYQRRNTGNEVKFKALSGGLGVPWFRLE